MTGTAFTRLKGPEDRTLGQRLRDSVVRAVKPYVAAVALSMCRFEPIAEPPKRKTMILFKPGEREALKAEAEADERQGRFIAAGIKYAQVGESHRAYEMIRKCLSAGIENGKEHIMAAIEEYC